MFCKKCGKQLKDGAQFCQYCGERHCEWYEGRIAPEDFHDESILNPYEIANRDLIVQYEKDMGYQ